jgi:hypothetical protein
VHASGLVGEIRHSTDGAVILKWSLVMRNWKEEQAAISSRVLNAMLSMTMGRLAVRFFKKRKWFWAIVSSELNILSGACAVGMLKEE